MTTETQTQAQPIRSAEKPASRVRGFRFSKSTGQRIRLTISYFLLVTGAITMVFPLVWMFLASFKPEWQILTIPPIWLPSEWIHAQAGDTTKEIALWNVGRSGGRR